MLPYYYTNIPFLSNSQRQCIFPMYTYICFPQDMLWQLFISATHYEKKRLIFFPHHFCGEMTAVWHAVGGPRLRWSAHGLNTGARWWPRNVFSKPWTGTWFQAPPVPVGRQLARLKLTQLDGAWFWIRVMVRSGRMGRFYHFDPYRNCNSFFFPCALVAKYCLYHFIIFKQGNIPSQFSIFNFFKNTEKNPSFSQFNYINSGRWRINEAFNRLRWRLRSWIGDFLAQKSPTNGLLKWTWMMNLWDSWTKFCWFVASKLVTDMFFMQCCMVSIWCLITVSVAWVLFLHRDFSTTIYDVYIYMIIYACESTCSYLEKR